MKTTMRTCGWITSLGLMLALSACSDKSADSGSRAGQRQAPSDAATTPDPVTAPLSNVWQDILDARQVDYPRALRRASLRLRRSLPTMTEMQQLQSAADPAQTYAAIVEAYLQSPQFQMQMIDFFRMTFRTGLPPASDSSAVDENQPFERRQLIRDSAAVYAAQIAVEDRSFAELFTTQSCPRYDASTQSFSPRDCNAEMQALSDLFAQIAFPFAFQDSIPAGGICAHPGVMGAFTSNLAFRRVRWVQEVFRGKSFPAHIADAQDIGGAAPYTGEHPFDSITGGLNAPEGHDGPDFHSADSVICANCHNDMNHWAPLFMGFGLQGFYNANQAQVFTPSGRFATRRDYLPDEEPTAFRAGQPVSNLGEFCTALSQSREVHCTVVARLWNWMMGRGDVVDARALVPDEALQPLCSSFEDNGLRIRDALRSITRHDDFVRF